MKWRVWVGRYMATKAVDVFFNGLRRTDRMMESTAEVVMVSQMAELRHPICDTVDDKIAGYLHYHCSA